VITLAATDYGMQLVLSALLKILGVEAPRLKLAVRPVNTSTLSADMRERVVDLALAVPQFIPTGLQSMELFSESYVGAVRHDHPLAASPVTLDGFCAFSHLLVSPNRGDFHGPTDDALAKLGRKRDVALVVPSFSVVGALLEASDLIAVWPNCRGDCFMCLIRLCRSKASPSARSGPTFWMLMQCSNGSGTRCFRRRGTWGAACCPQINYRVKLPFTLRCQNLEHVLCPPFVWNVIT
jgi:DNA-binding transcriptional LysR family regulator